MPIYEYECLRCGNIEEALQKISDKPLIKCSHCSGKLQKLISQSSFHLKGSGWYVTDYASKSGKGNQSSQKNDIAPTKEVSAKSSAKASQGKAPSTSKKTGASTSS